MSFGENNSVSKLLLLYYLWESRQEDMLLCSEKRLCRTSFPADVEEVVSFPGGQRQELGSEGTHVKESRKNRSS